MSRKENENRLTEAQQRFCDAYLADTDRNGTRAYLQLHPNAKQATARASASRMLTNHNVAAYIEQKENELHQKLMTQYEATEDKIIRELAAMAFVRLTDFLSWGPDGIHIKDSARLDEMQQRGVVEIRQTKEGIHVKLKKLEALTKLGERLGLFRRSNEESSGLTVYLNHDLSAADET